MNIINCGVSWIVWCHMFSFTYRVSWYHMFSFTYRVRWYHVLSITYRVRWYHTFSFTYRVRWFHAFNISYRVRWYCLVSCVLYLIHLRLKRLAAHNEGRHAGAARHALARVRFVHAEQDARSE